MIPLGAFDLHARLGEGGMGEVWQGVHRGQHVPVAVKVLTKPLARKKAFRRAFLEEVRAVAGLEHPNVVLVFDYGMVSAETEAASDGALQAGTPWLAMELAEEGTLESGDGTMGWAQLRRVLGALLDSLGHAHARGVIHRDIKPANVLVCRGGRLKLTDFGLAHAMDRHDGELTAGTPSYMAPEQFDGRWRDYGPWTDLYAVGCLAHALGAGAPPFGVLKDWMKARELHHYTTAPRIHPTFPVPEGFHAWVERLLAKDPRDRWRRCADAAAALGHLVDPPSMEGPVAPGGASSLTRTAPRPPVSQTRVRASIPIGAADRASPDAAAPVTRTLEGVAVHDPSVAPVVVPLAAADRPPLPGTWRRPELPARSPRLVGAGLGLFGLRTIPLVGRRSEQEVLWRALAAVHGDGEARAVVVRGPSGCGKSRLIQWFTERAHEVGAACALVGKPAEGGGGDVLGAMLLRWLRCTGLDRVDVYRRVAAQLAAVGVVEPRAWDRAMELLWPVAGPGGLGGQRRLGLCRLLATLTAERPLIVWVDDAHHCPEAVAFCQDLLDTCGQAPILAIVTARDEVDGQTGAGPLRSLANHARSVVCPLGPLGEGDRAELVRHLLALEPALALEVERRTSGHPLFAVQLVGQWVHRGLLEPGRHGFRLKDGAVAEVPRDLRQLWAERVQRFLAAQPAEASVALEIAAILGAEVRQREWAAACAHAGVAIPGGLADALCGAQLARRVGGDWAFVHGLVLAVLEGRARKNGRFEAHNEACAETLATSELRGVAERRARHWLATSTRHAAVGPLLEAIDERLLMGEHARANELLLERDRVLDQLGDPSKDMAVGEGWVRWGRLAERLGRLADARAWGQRAVDAAMTHRWGRVLVDGHLLLAAVARRHGELGRASQHLFDADRVAQADRTRWRLGLVRLEAARVYRERRESDRATEALQSARSDFEAAEDPLSVAEVFLELARLSSDDGRGGAARVLLDWSRARYRWLACPLGLARCHLLDAQVSRLEGALDRAGQQVEDALSLFGRLGSSERLHAELEVGRQALVRGDLDRAERSARTVARKWSIQQEGPALELAEALLLAVAVARGSGGIAA